MKAKKLFDLSFGYYKSIEIVDQSGNPQTFISSTVMKGFCLELLFKSLYLIDKGTDFKVNGKHSHDIYKLFHDLPVKTQISLIQSKPPVIAISRRFFPAAS